MLFHQIRVRSANLYIPEYGGEVFKLGGFVINHFSYMKQVWDTLIIVLILYTSFVMPYMSSFDIQVRYIVCAAKHAKYYVEFSVYYNIFHKLEIKKAFIGLKSGVYGCIV